MDYAGQIKRSMKLLHSRMTATNEIVRMMNELHPKPQVLINASAIGYYGMSKHKNSPR